MKLNNSQLQSVQHFKGPMMVLAGPGSGKTSVLIQRINHLISECHVHPENILAVTFSRAAAKELEKRYSSMSFQGSSSPTFGTFHSIFFGILKDSLGLNARNIITESKRIEIVEREILKYSFESDDEQLYESVLNEIGNIKGNLADLNSYVSSSLPEELFRQVFREYNRSLRDSRLYDFDDMLLFAYKLLKDNPEILTQCREKNRFILVDEFQDINMLQYEIIKMISFPLNNLFVVGDDDQSIYGFRGANPEIMQRFTKDYPDCARVILNINYRSTSAIIKAASKVINRNKNRFNKKIIPASDTEGESFFLKNFPERKAEADHIIELIKSKTAEGCPLSEIAVLFRNNYDYEYLISRLFREAIPVMVNHEFRSSKFTFAVKDIQSFIHIASGKVSRADFIRVMNKPSRLISREAVSEEDIFLNLKRYYFRRSPKILNSIRIFESQMLFLKDMTPYAALNYFFNVIGYKSFLSEYAREHSIDDSSLQEFIENVISAASGSKSFIEFEKNLQLLNAPQKGDKNGVQVMTMHASKGLEFNIVIIPGVNAGAIPSKRAKTPQSIEEERRLLYVAMTRARNELHISYLDSYRGKNTGRSEFIKDL